VSLSFVLQKTEKQVAAQLIAEQGVKFKELKLSKLNLSGTFQFEGRHVKYDVKCKGSDLILVHGTL